MIKPYCDIYVRLLNPASYVNDKDQDDYTYGEIGVDFGTWFKIDDVCNGCSDKHHEITKNNVNSYKNLLTIRKIGI